MLTPISTANATPPSMIEGSATARRCKAYEPLEIPEMRVGQAHMTSIYTMRPIVTVITMKGRTLTFHLSSLPFCILYLAKVFRQFYYIIKVFKSSRFLIMFWNPSNFKNLPMRIIENLHINVKNVEMEGKNNEIKTS